MTRESAEIFASMKIHVFSCTSFYYSIYQILGAVLYLRNTISRIFHFFQVSHDPLKMEERKAKDKKKGEKYSE